MRARFILAIALMLSAAGFITAAEPNETFATRTILGPGVLTVADDLEFPVFPDTMLGSRDLFGSIEFFSDDDGPFEGAGGSALYGIPTNSGSIAFAVTGWPDENFDGFHSESGHYKVFVEVYDFFDDPVASFSEVHILQPGIVDEFFYPGEAEWNGGSYDVEIDNTVSPFDVDFFTFTGLTAGSNFTARTLDPENLNLDTFLGWYDGAGAVVETDDDDGGGVLSLISGTVPASETLTFAVTGFGDDFFGGAHDEFGSYELALELSGSSLAGDYNSDGTVDAADYVVWRRTDGSIGGYNTWRTNFGDSNGAGGTAVPEPSAFVLVALAATLCVFSRRTRAWIA